MDARRARRTGSSCARRCEAFEDYEDLVRGARADRGDQGRDLVEHGRRRCGRPAWSTGFPSTSSRTSRRATTRRTSGSQHAVLASYRHEFRYMTTSSWNRDRLRELGTGRRADPARDRPRHLPAAARRRAARRRDPGAGPLEPAQEPPADARRLALAARAAARAVAVRSRAASWPTGQPGVRYFDRSHRRRGQPSCSPRRPCSCRPRPTRASACPRSRRWPPAARSSAPTRTATWISASTSRTAWCPRPSAASVARRSGAAARRSGPARVARPRRDRDRRGLRLAAPDRRARAFFTEIARPREIAPSTEAVPDLQPIRRELEIFGHVRRGTVEHAQAEHETTTTIPMGTSNLTPPPSNAVADGVAWLIIA